MVGNPERDTAYETYFKRHDAELQKIIEKSGFTSEQFFERTRNIYRKFLAVFMNEGKEFAKVQKNLDNLITARRKENSAWQKESIETIIPECLVSLKDICNGEGCNTKDTDLCYAVINQIYSALELPDEKARKTGAEISDRDHYFLLALHKYLNLWIDAIYYGVYNGFNESHKLHVSDVHHPVDDNTKEEWNSFADIVSEFETGKC